MYLDLLNSDNNISVNITLAQLLGLSGAVYCSELLNIFKKAHKKKKLVDEDYFTVDRDYIQERTTITYDEQVELDDKWVEMELLRKHPTKSNTISLNVLLLVDLIADIDSFNGDEIERLKDKLSTQTESEKKENKKVFQKRSFKKLFVYNNVQLNEALCNWVDAVFAKKLTMPIVEMFLNRLNSYTNGDYDKAIKIVNIATIQGWKDCQWAINSYEKQKNYETNTPRTTQQEKATKDTINRDILF